MMRMKKTSLHTGSMPDLDIQFVFDNPHKKLYKGVRMTYADWCNKHGYKFCKLGEGIPKEWLDKQDAK